MIWVDKSYWHIFDVVRWFQLKIYFLINEGLSVSQRFQDERERVERAHCRGSKKGPWKWLRDWSISSMKKGWESQDYSAWRREDLEWEEREISSVCGARLFLVIPSARTRGSGYDQKYRRCYLNIRKHFLNGKMNEHRHRAPREVVELSSLEIFRSHLDNLL